MNFKKQQALNLLKKWNKEDKAEILKSRVFDNSYIPYFDTVGFDEAIYEYFDNLKTLIKESKISSTDEIFDKAWDELTTIAHNNANLYGGNWDEDDLEKIDYMLENHKYAIVEDDNITNLRGIVGIVDIYILTDFLTQFSDECKSEFEKELDLLASKEMNM